MNNTINIVPFYNGPFSQWYNSPFKAKPLSLPMLTFDFANCEQYMMFEKAMLFDDEDTAKEIMKTNDPKKIKALGRQVKNFNENIWTKNREKIVYTGNLHKFSQNPELLIYLLKTGKAILVEASPYDKIWGVGIAENDPEIYNIKSWRGLNLLGKILMQVRTALNPNIEQKNKA